MSTAVQDAEAAADAAKAAVDHAEADIASGRDSVSVGLLTGIDYPLSRKRGRD